MVDINMCGKPCGKCGQPLGDGGKGRSITGLGISTELDRRVSKNKRGERRENPGNEGQARKMKGSRPA